MTNYPVFAGFYCANGYAAACSAYPESSEKNFWILRKIFWEAA